MMLGGLLFVVCVILQFHYHDPIPWYIWVLALIAQFVAFGEPAMRSAAAKRTELRKVLKGAFMASDDARILVIGAGVNGSFIAERLFERGMGVTVLARGKRLAEIQSNGIVIENPCHNQATNAEASAERGVSTTCP